MRYAGEKGIPASARGSACGALVSYLLHLSNVCPLKYDLLFERFLDPNRSEAPDIDIDLCQARRYEVIEYVRKKYGDANVAQIVTFGTLKTKAAIKDVGRALNIPLARVEQINKLVPARLNITLDQALKEEPALRRMGEEDPEVGRLLDFARRLEGMNRNVGTHAAGVVIADRPLEELVPLQKIPNKDKAKEVVTTQWEMGDIEKAGLLKMDFLGLRNLTTTAAAVRLINQRHPEAPIDLDHLPLDDPKTFELLQRGETKGVFQLESSGIRDLLIKMKPDRFADIIATNALYRPGPLNGGMVDEYVDVKNGRKQASYLHPVLKEVLEETYGVMVYQEQVMRILNRLGGIELSTAYATIKAISKKKADTIAKSRDQFIKGAHEQGLDRDKAAKIFELIVHFGGYGFNKSHSTAYALVAFQTAYLKAHYPTEFMAAVLSSEMDGAERDKFFVEHIDDCRRMGIEVLLPNINEGHVDFRVASEGKIHFGLAAIKGVGFKAVEAIVKARELERPVPEPGRLLRAGLGPGRRRRLRRDADPGGGIRLSRCPQAQSAAHSAPLRAAASHPVGPGQARRSAPRPAWAVRPDRCSRDQWPFQRNRHGADEPAGRSRKCRTPSSWPTRRRHSAFICPAIPWRDMRNCCRPWQPTRSPT